MLEPNHPVHESDRVRTLHSLNVLNSKPEERFDALTRAARRMFSVSIAQVSLIDSDRQWIKSSAGWPPAEAPRKVSFCAHAILKNEVMHVEDALADERFADNPLVLGEPYIRFYAGSPLRIGGHGLGTFCLIDRTPRAFNDRDRVVLKDLSAMVEEILVTEHREATDDLTGLTNRSGFETLARHVLGLCKRQGGRAALLAVRLEGLNAIAQRIGVAEGDRAMKFFAGCMIGAFGENSTVARVGADEFAVLAPDSPVTSVEGAMAKVRVQLDEWNRGESRGHKLGFNTVSVDIDPTQNEPVKDILRKTDAIMRTPRTDS